MRAAAAARVGTGTRASAAGAKHAVVTSKRGGGVVKTSTAPVRAVAPAKAAASSKQIVKEKRGGTPARKKR